MTFAEIQEMAGQIGLVCEPHAFGYRLTYGDGVPIASHVSKTDLAFIVRAKFLQHRDVSNRRNASPPS